ncbi:39S ribosomal protein L21, mitochondrial isoform X1 [Silurus meridionalis]|nr:39S ribosomal protein L21, mitochondrial isoform X1 [Silurus meridionalis]
MATGLKSGQGLLRACRRLACHTKQTPVVEKVNSLLEKREYGRLFAVVHFASRQWKVTNEDLIQIENHIEAECGDRILLEKENDLGSGRKKRFALLHFPSTVTVSREKAEVSGAACEIPDCLRFRLRYFCGYLTPRSERIHISYRPAADGPPDQHHRGVSHTHLTPPRSSDYNPDGSSRGFECNGARMNVCPLFVTTAI